MKLPNNTLPPPKPQQSTEAEQPPKDEKSKSKSKKREPMFSTDPTIEAAMLSVWTMTSRKAREKAKEVNEG